MDIDDRIKDVDLHLVLGNQLFPISNVSKINPTKIFMREDYGLCTYYKHHKQKIYYFLASMREYRDYLSLNDFKISYIELEKNPNTVFIAIIKICFRFHLVSSEKIQKISKPIPRLTFPKIDAIPPIQHEKSARTMDKARLDVSYSIDKTWDGAPLNHSTQVLKYLHHTSKTKILHKMKLYIRW